MTNYQELSPSSRVWIYQSNRPFTAVEGEAIRMQIQEFVTQWTSHNNALKTWGDLVHDRFVVLMVDESMAGASGCSIDKSVAFVKQVEQATGVDMFDRFNFAYKDSEKVLSASREEFEQLFKEGKIGEETVVFNNLVQTKAEFEAKWAVKLGDSWHKNFV